LFGVCPTPVGCHSRCRLARPPRSHVP
jgi:hypothetical protein